MTKDEIREFVRRQIEQCIKQPDVIDGAVNRITNTWMEDVQENRDEAFQNGVDGERTNWEMYPR